VAVHRAGGFFWLGLGGEAMNEVDRGLAKRPFSPEARASFSTHALDGLGSRSLEMFRPARAAIESRECSCARVPPSRQKPSCEIFPWLAVNLSTIWFQDCCNRATF